LNQGEKDSSLS